MNLEPITYDNLEPIRIPVTIGKTQYELRECDESGAIAVKSAALGGVELVTEEGKGNVIRNLGGSSLINITIVSQCLYENIGRATNEIADRWRKVTAERVRALPPKLVRELAKRANEISELDDPTDIESLRKQRDAIQKRIDKLEADLPNAEQEGGETTSASPTS